MQTTLPDEVQKTQRIPEFVLLLFSIITQVGIADCLFQQERLLFREDGFFGVFMAERTNLMDAEFSLIGALVEYFFVAMCGVYECFHGCKVWK